MKRTIGKWVLPVLFSLIAGLLAAPYAEAVCVKEKRANLRKGPGLHFQKLWEVFKYMPFEKMEQKGDWIQVKDVDGDIYWVFRKLVTQSYLCAVVKQNKTNLRAGPGTNHPKVAWSPVDKYFSMKVLQIKDPWVKIEDGEGDVAWIYRPLVWIQ
ncbi:MAG: SH3 domain-containing protein [Nitrospinales bacterium]